MTPLATDYDGSVFADEPIAHPVQTQGGILREVPIILPGGGVSITECASALFQRIGPTRTLFQRGGATVEIAEDKDGVSNLSIVTASAFRSRLEAYGDLLAWRSGEGRALVLKPSVCPEETAKALLDTKEAREHLPPIAMLTRCPVMVPGGAGEIEILSKGYHALNGGILVTAGTEPREVEFREGIRTLTDLLSEFDFASPGDRSRAIASLITPALKMGGWLPGYVPVDVAEADQSQSGKTFRQRLVGAIYDERLVIVALRRGGVGSVDESFSQKLIEGRPFLQLDNFRSKLDSPFLEAFLTADSEISARVPHRAEVRIDPSKFFVFLSSNGVETTRDFANRSSIVRIRKRTGYTFQCYPEGDLLAHVRAKQSYYLGAVFAVIREWCRRGKPRTGELRHDFTEWAQILDWIVQNIFGGAPLMDGHQIAQKRVSDLTLSFLRKLSYAVEQRSRLGQALTSSNLAEICDEEDDLEIPGLRGGAHQDPALRIGTVMGKAFREGHGTERDATRITVEGFTITRSEVQTVRSDGGGAYTAKSYTFTRDGFKQADNDPSDVGFGSSQVARAAQGAQGAQGVQCMENTGVFQEVQGLVRPVRGADDADRNNGASTNGPGGRDGETFDALTAAARIFGGRIIPNDGLDADMHDRLESIDKVLAQRDSRGRISYTGTEIESCAIGLRRHAGAHPRIDAMLSRLEAAKKNALTWQAMARRR